MTDNTADKIAALEREVAELKAKVSPPPKPEFKPAPYQQYDPTAGMCMPPSALRAMVAAEPRGFMRDVVGDNRAPTGRPGVIPTIGASGEGPKGGGDGTGWAPQIPLGPQPGIYRVDEQLIADEVRQRAELKRKLGE
jgi:hypothetical protein